MCQISELQQWQCAEISCHQLTTAVLGELLIVMASAEKKMLQVSSGELAECSNAVDWHGLASLCTEMVTEIEKLERPEKRELAPVKDQMPTSSRGCHR